MRKTKELDTCQTLFYLMGTNEKIKLLAESNLHAKERQLLTYRIIDGLSLKEIATILNLEEDSVNKAQLKAYKKLYAWLVFEKQIPMK